MERTRSGAGGRRAAAVHGARTGVLPVAASGAGAIVSGVVVGVVPDNLPGWPSLPHVISLQAFPPVAQAAELLTLIGTPLGPLHLAFGGALTGIAAAIAGAIAAKIYADRRPKPAAAGTASRPRSMGQDVVIDDEERSPKPFTPPPPPARIRLGLPPEEPAPPDEATAPQTHDEPDAPGDTLAG